MLATAPALAQDAGTDQDAGAEQDSAGIAEILVTAQKRAENVQDVPIAISAFTAEALPERAVCSVAQLSAIAPNVNLDRSAERPVGNECVITCGSRWLPVHVNTNINSSTTYNTSAV